MFERCLATAQPTGTIMTSGIQKKIKTMRMMTPRLRLTPQKATLEFVTQMKRITKNPVPTLLTILFKTFGSPLESQPRGLQWPRTA